MSDHNQTESVITIHRNAQAISDGCMPQPQRSRRGHHDRWLGLAAAGQDAGDDVSGMDALTQRFLAAASIADRSSLNTLLRMATICRSPSATLASLRRTGSSPDGGSQSLNGAPFLRAPDLRARTGT